jgi:hypothetical protein
LETTQIDCLGVRLTVPTQGEMLRIKGVLILSTGSQKKVSITPPRVVATIRSSP